MKCFRVSLALIAFVWSHSVLAVETGAFAWPEGRKAAVSLAYDDALDSQLDNAIPALDRYGLKGSFYLQLSRDPVRLRLEEWRAAARNGHELGNHTLFHQCSGSLKDRDWVEPQRDLDRTSVAAMKEQVLLANVMLTAIDGKTERTMTVPCGDVMAEGVNYIDAVRQEFVAIKLGDGAVTPDMQQLDPYAVTVETPVGVTGKQLIARVEEAARKGTMVNFTFHGIGGDYLSVSKQAHEELLQYLSSHRDIYWVDTFINLMKYVRQQQSRDRAITAQATHVPCSGLTGDVCGALCDAIQAVNCGRRTARAGFRVLVMVNRDLMRIRCRDEAEYSGIRVDQPRPRST